MQARASTYPNGKARVLPARVSSTGFGYIAAAQKSTPPTRVKSKTSLKGTLMCKPVTCKICGKITWEGCGKHIDEVKASVPADQ